MGKRYFDLERPDADDWAMISRSGRTGAGLGSVVHCLGPAQRCFHCQEHEGCVAECMVIQFLGDAGLRYDKLGFPACWPREGLMRIGPDDPSKCQSPDGKRLRDNKK